MCRQKSITAALELRRAMGPEAGARKVRLHPLQLDNRKVRHLQRLHRKICHLASPDDEDASGGSAVV